MKSTISVVALLLSTLTMTGKSYSEEQLPELTGPYVGQTTPGLTPREFAPRGRTPEQRDHSGFFSPDMKEFYFTRRNNTDGKWTLITYKLEDGKWQESVVGPRMGRPIFSPDGKTMHLGKRFMQRTDSGWTEIKSLGAPYDDIRIMRLMSSAQGTYFFDDVHETSPIRYARIVNGKREQPKAVEIDFGDWNAHPFIAPDESYLIWDEQDDKGYGRADLFISFRQDDGSWGTAINLGNEINTEASENGATVTPDGKYLFFNRYVNDQNAGMHWVDAQVIENLRVKSQNKDNKTLASHKE